MVTPQENLGQWINEHYDFVTDDGTPRLSCRRCGTAVTYVTKHAVVRHGDPIEIMPVSDGNEALASTY